MFHDTFKGLQRELARAILRPLFAFHFIRRRALALLAAHYDKGELTLRYRLPDHTLLLDPRDDVIAARVLLRGDWQRRDLMRVVALLKTRVPASEGKIFVDVGANIGTETVYAMLSGFFSGAVSIEPEPRNFAFLSENIAANALQSRVRIVKCAVAATVGRGELARSHSNMGGHAIAAGTGSDDRINVELRPLDSILADAGIAPAEAGLVWIDVNGTEDDVLAGMPALLSQRVPLVLEHLPSFISETTARNIHRILSAHYRCFCRVDDVDHEPADIKRFDPLKDTGDFLFY
ncbi:MAG: FkbM family methyltransferase [Hyphomicrobiales bacterium]